MNRVNFQSTGWDDRNEQYMPLCRIYKMLFVQEDKYEWGNPENNFLDLTQGRTTQKKFMF